VYSSVVSEYWSSGRDSDSTPEDHLQVVVDGTAVGRRAVTTLVVMHGPRVVTVAPAYAERLGLREGELVSEAQLLVRLAEAGIAMNGPDHLFYLPLEKVPAVQSELPYAGTRRLTPEDSAEFERFCATAPAADLDEAFVELDHWLVYGTFADDRLVAAASMYPWGDTKLADLGVIALPGYRGKGYAKTTVRAISAHAIADGYEPQYRCQIDNAPSIALALAAGFELFGQCDVLAEDSSP